MIMAMIMLQQVTGITKIPRFMVENVEMFCELFPFQYFRFMLSENLKGNS